MLIKNILKPRLSSKYIGKFTMKQHDYYSTLLSFVLFLVTMSGPVVADSVTRQIYESFNNMNSGSGYLFMKQFTPTNSSDLYYNQGLHSGEIRLENASDLLVGQTPDLSAYQLGVTANAGAGTGFNFQTFCVAPELLNATGEYSMGQLNYFEFNQTRTASKISLTVGVAWLYKEFAAGNLGEGTPFAYEYNYGTDRMNSAVILQDAIWYLMGAGLQGQDRLNYLGNMVNPNTDWNNNIFLAYLRSMESDVNFWLGVYDPADNYNGFMGDAKVFVLNVNPITRSIGEPRQDVLYVTRNNGNDVPEPACILLWMLASLGAGGTVGRQTPKISKMISFLR